ncbi:hypothetical protein Godav_019948 [Gossypium davidsonii]|uniref:Uncharacterized protein n=2 Tax=Gossypium TaxID=3633 RepID=A0A7J8R1G4_GOSDV|nr:hypothetical protein [Gossypium davidsonii]
MEASMITSKKLMRMTRKWQKMASIGRKRIASTWPTRKMAAANHSNKSSIVDKGCFSIYTMDKKRFVIPLAFLSNSVFCELFKMSEEEFGLPSDGPITLPCDSVVMNYIVSIVKRGLAKDLEKAVLNFITTYSCSLDTYADQGHADQQSVLKAIMVSTKELIKMARKWNKIAAIGRKRITSPRSNNPMMANADNSNKSSVVGKGYFVAYTMDKKRFLIPLAFLNNSIFQALLKMSEEEFGLSSNRPLTFLCDSVIMSYIVLLVRRELAKDLEKAVVNSITSNSCSSCSMYYCHGARTNCGP